MEDRLAMWISPLSGQEGRQPVRQFVEVLGLAFPNHQTPVPKLPELFNALGISDNIALELFLPELDIGLGHSRPLATFMNMPEAAMNEDHSLPAGKDDVGSAGKVFAMQTETVAEGVEELADTEFGLGVLAADSGHD